MIYCIIAFIGVFVFLMISLVISTKRRIIKSYYMEIEPIKFKPQEINYELNETNVQQ